MINRLVLAFVSASLAIPLVAFGGTRKVTGTLEQAQVIPAIAADAAVVGSGTLNGTYDDSSGTLTLRVEYTGLTNVTGAAIHQGAKGASGPVVFPVSVPITVDGGAADAGDMDGGVGFDQSFTFTMNEGKVDLLGERMYMNIRTSSRPAGALRAQLIPEPGPDAGARDGGPIVSDAAASLDGSTPTNDAAAVVDNGGATTGGGGCSTATESGGGLSMLGLGLGIAVLVRARKRRSS
jgi:uncharacterized protein (TIGR03382 family)